MRFWGRIFEELVRVHVGGNPIESKQLLKKPEYGIRSKRSWEDIYDCLQSARVQFDATKPRFWGRFKRGYRGVVEQSGTIRVASTALRFLPDHELVSPVMAALETVQVASATREKVTTAVSCDKLEDTFAKMENFPTIFPGDENITNTSISLLACVLSATGKTIAYFLSSTTSRALTPLKDGEDYQQELLASTEDIQVAMSKLSQEVQISDIAGAHQRNPTSHQGVSQPEAPYDHAGTGTKVTPLVLGTGLTTTAALLLNERSSSAGRNAPFLYATWPSSASIFFRTKRSRHSIDDIADITAIVESSHSIPLKYRSRAQQAISSTQFHSWAIAATSRELLVRGSPEPDPTYAKAAMSLVTTLLVLGLRAPKRGPDIQACFASLIFFCELHTDSDDAYARGGPTSELSAATFWQRDIDFESLQRFPYDTGVLCRLSRLLISQLPRKMTVVGVIDNIERHEADEFEDGTRFVLDWLLGLARDQDIPPAVKILVTSPVGIISTHEAFDREDGEEENVLCLEGFVSIGTEYGMMGVDVEEGRRNNQSRY
ncbi:hypothetical protein QBC36DRAFT_366686 [Triangularia setosa]|uniref:Uncharacterized protein n=1 Tax=Triangularia setosa TaxID=2587417 RepID=A0AAN6VXA0_9PEZI|nr:hypothetical protein QBC36DRAFT_366686 [Podospora setosa]